jgi:hypothetical protein
MEKYFQISDPALRVSLVSHFMTLTGGDLEINEERNLKTLMREISGILYNGDPKNGSSKSIASMHMLNLISKFTDDHNLEAKTAQQLITHRNDDVSRGIIKRNPEDFLKLELEMRFKYFFALLIEMNINITEAYAEIDRLEEKVRNL